MTQGWMHKNRFGVRAIVIALLLLLSPIVALDVMAQTGDPSLCTGNSNCDNGAWQTSGYPSVGICYAAYGVIGCGDGGACFGNTNCEGNAWQSGGYSSRSACYAAYGVTGCHNIEEGTCTNDAAYTPPMPPPGQGLISTIVNNIKAVLNGVAAVMFKGIVNDAGFLKAVTALATLYVAIYGILFTFGMVQITIHDFMIRLIKIGVIILLISPGSLAFFISSPGLEPGILVKFFNNGTDSIISMMTAIALPVGNNGGVVFSGTPFAVMDNAIAQAVSAKMAITLMAVFTTGPYGPIIGILLLMSLGSFLKALINALWVYVMSLIMKTLLFGLAPIFIACVLFARTRHLFDGWINQLVNASLQPILLFTFFAFFVTLIKACIDQIMGYNICWTEWAELARGGPFSGHFWRFAICAAGQTDPTTGQCLRWEPYDGIWDFNGANVPGSGVTPISIMLPLTMWLLADLAGRFNRTVIMISQEISSAATDLTMGSMALPRWLAGGASSAGSAAAGTTGAGGSTGFMRQIQNLIGRR